MIFARVGWISGNRPVKIGLYWIFSRMRQTNGCASGSNLLIGNSALSVHKSTAAEPFHCT